MTTTSPWVTLATRLEREWTTLVDDTPASTLERWGREYSHLAGLHRLDDIGKRIDEHAGDWPTRDGILLALIRLTQDGNQLAGRVLIHVLRRGLSTLVKDAAHILRKAGSVYDGVDAGEQVLGTLWEVIATYPLHRDTRVAANLLLDTQQVLIRGNTARTTTPGMTSRAARTELATADASLLQHFAPAAEDTYLEASPADELAELLDWATRARVITADEAAFLTDICATPPTGARYAYERAATRHGITQPAARQRAHRLIARIRGALPLEAAAA